MGVNFDLNLLIELLSSFSRFMLNQHKLGFILGLADAMKVQLLFQHFYTQQQCVTAGVFSSNPFIIFS